MKRDYLSEFLPDLEEFTEKTMQFHRKELTVAQYKGFSGGYGSYAQRGAAKHMLRLRMAGGRLTKDRLKFIVDTTEKYHIDLLKLTTCQSVQMHNLEASDLCEIIPEAWKAGMISRGGGGDFPRNVMASSLSGLQKDEYFDVLPYAEAAADYLMHYIKEVKFPRKLKVCFSNSPANEPHATFRDLGFVARPDGSFDIYAAGGLGGKPRLGVQVAEAVDPSQILYYIDAMVQTFVTHGNYENRGKARTRFLQESLGVDGFKDAFNEKLAKAKSDNTLEISVQIPEITKTGFGVPAENKRIIPQKQTGLYAVFYQPVGGVLTPSKARELYDLIKDMDEVEIRITPAEGLYVVNCNAKEAEAVLAATSDSAATRFEQSVACIGNSICQVGLGDSQAMLLKCVEEVRKENFGYDVLPKVHFSGCPSSCSAHQTGEMGFRGAMKQTPDGPKPAFAIFVGGCELQGKEVIADTGINKAIANDDIPKFFVELGKTVTAAGCSYQEWAAQNPDKLEELIAKYTA